MVVFKLPEDAALTTSAEANGTPLLRLSDVGGWKSFSRSANVTLSESVEAVEK
jgi:hypothetical protein